MADRTLVVRLKAELGRFQADMAGAAATTKRVGDAATGMQKRAGGALAGLSANIRANRADWDALGRGMMIGGAAIVGGLGLAAKAAIDWESAWAGVTKTVDGSPEQMAELEAGLRGLAKELPATHEEIAGVAEAAGQLGVARDDILGFTETAIALGESTNLSAEEAATSLAKFSNIMGTTAREGVEGYEKLGSTLVALGNDGASTEKDIMQMALRLAGAGKQIGATESDILAMANALTSVGIEAQLGGGAMSRGLLQMNSAVISGGEELQKFAEISGMTASEFATAWRKDPIAAANEFIGGLGRVGESGGDAAAALESVGLKGTQNAQVFLRAAGASDLMTESLKLGESAWEANSALAEEASKRYSTTESRLKIARNTFKDAAIDLGSVLGPALAAVAEKAAGLANAFVKLPKPVQGAITGLAGVSGAALLLGGAAIKAIGWSQDIKDSMDRIGASSPKAGKALRGVAKAGVALAAIQVGRLAVGALQGAFDEAVPSAEALTLALENLHKSGDLSEINRGIENLDVKRSSAAAVSIQNMGEAVQFLSNQSKTDKTRDMVQGWVGMDSDVDRLTEYVGGLDQALADMYDQDPTKARETWATMVVETRKAGGSIEDLRKQFPMAAAAAKQAASDGSQYEDHLEQVEKDAEEAKQALEDLKNELTQLGGGFRAEQAAAQAVEESLSGLRDVVKDSKSGWTELSGAMAQSAEDALSYAGAQAEMGRGSGEIAAGISQVREQVIQSGVASGRSRSFMEDYADSIGLIPGEARTIVEAAGVERSTANVMALSDQILLLNGKTVTVKEEGANPSKGRVMELRGSVFGLSDKTVKVTEIGSTAAGDRVVRFKGEIYTLRGKDVKVTENGADAARGRTDAFKRKIDQIDKETSAHVTEHGADAARGRVDNFSGSVNDVPGSKSSDVSARVRGWWDVDGLVRSISNVQPKTVTITAIGKKIGSWVNADGGMYSPSSMGMWPTFADGGMASFQGQSPQIRRAGGMGVTWAEEGAGPWEAFISGHPGKRARSEAIWRQTGHRLGLLEAAAASRPEKFADGGMRQYATAPPPRRHYVAPPPRVTVQAPQSQQAVPAGASAAQIEAAITRAFTGVKITTNINGRDFAGVMQRTTNDRKGR